MNYQQALDYLYQFIHGQRIPSASDEAAAQKLARMRALLAKLANPHHSVRSVLIAGTNGKGSTAALLERICATAGYKTGLWTSPHLATYRERIQINRQLISQSALVALVERLRFVLDSFDVASWGHPTTFELGFALALCYFSQHQVDIALLEVGIGGRFDSTNVITPLLSLITSLGYDHQDILGDTLHQIAYDKAGILKPHIPAITVPQQVEVYDVLLSVAADVGAPLYVADQHALCQVFPCNSGACSPDRSPTMTIPYPVEPTPTLRGLFQQVNARIAMAAALLLRSNGFVLADDAIRHALATTQWYGRMELVRTSPCLVIDGAHNADAAQNLVAALHAEFTFERLILIFGVSRDKHVDALAAVLIPAANVVILTCSDHPRAERDLNHLALRISPYLHGILVLNADIGDALQDALMHAGSNDVICVAGSLFVAGAAREALGLPPFRD